MVQDSDQLSIDELRSELVNARTRATKSAYDAEAARHVSGISLQSTSRIAEPAKTVRPLGTNAARGGRVRRLLVSFRNQRSDFEELAGTVLDEAHTPPHAVSGPAVQEPSDAQKAAEVEAKRKEVEKKAKDDAVEEQALQATLAGKLRAESQEHLKTLCRRLSLWSLIVILVGTGVLLGWVDPDSGVFRMSGWYSPGQEVTWNHAPFLIGVAALIVWLGVFVLSRWRASSGGVRAMLIGADGRVSTSYTQAWIWTLVLAATFIFLILQSALGIDATLVDSQEGGVLGINSDYLLLLGGPFAALLIAMQLDQAKVATGELSKIESPTTEVRDVFSNDAGRTDLVDTQYLIFNLVALVVFVALLVTDNTKLPDIPDELVLLTSGAALGYVARKAIQKNPPSILSVVAVGGSTVPIVGGWVQINGVNFVPAGAESDLAIGKLKVKFGDVVVRPQPMAEKPPQHVKDHPTLLADGISATALTVLVPDLSSDGLTERTVQLSIVNAAGVATVGFHTKVVSPVLRVRVTQPAAGDKTLTLDLLDPTKLADPVKVKIAEITQDAFWNSTTASLTVPIPPTVERVVTLTATASGATFSTQIIVAGV